MATHFSRFAKWAARHHQAEDLGFVAVGAQLVERVQGHADEIGGGGRQLRGPMDAFRSVVLADAKVVFAVRGENHLVEHASRCAPRRWRMRVADGQTEDGYSCWAVARTHCEQG